MSNKSQRPKGQKSKPASWVRDAGFIGDPSMEENESWNRSGAGVSEDEEEVGNMPNERCMKNPKKENLV